MLYRYCEWGGLSAIPSGAHGQMMRTVGASMVVIFGDGRSVRLGVCDDGPDEGAKGQ